eukprot:CAMPEP_0170608290 /NCGR_PEP_ID=MMETSP0224-20130122/21508_1 /TAXON_ID=285029 /ORGANISM="Togula jolla, Strain CCCM 725" /LENGTH=94 /DNA_ID=CAMNT_0010933511 /DNA_START=52 /DNA_END=336 /DNA_ORIENTATION=-
MASNRCRVGTGLSSSTPQQCHCNANAEGAQDEKAKQSIVRGAVKHHRVEHPRHAVPRLQAKPHVDVLFGSNVLAQLQVREDKVVQDFSSIEADF